MLKTALGIAALSVAAPTALAAAWFARHALRARKAQDRPFRRWAYRMSAILAAVAVVLAAAGLELLHG